MYKPSIKQILQRDDSRVYLAIVIVCTFVAAWHPLYLGFYCDDWILFVRGFELPSSAIYGAFPDFPRVLANVGIDPGIVVSRPGYAFALFIFKRLFADSMFLWQSIAAILLLIAALSIYSLVLELLRQFRYDYNDCRYGAAIAAAVYLIGPWSIVMSAWPTSSLTLLSLIFVSIGLARLISCSPGFSYLGIIFLLIGFSVYEAYWLLFIPLGMLLWLANVWSFRQSVIFIGIIFGVLLFLILVKFGVSKAWGVPPTAKKFNNEFLELFVNNIKAYPRVVGDALNPVSVEFFFGSVFTVVMFSLTLGGITVKLALALMVFLLSGLLSSALLYAVAGYGLSGRGIMSHTLSAQNVYFSLFIGIVMISPVVRWRAWWETDREGSRFITSMFNIALLSTWCAFLVLVVSLGIGMVKRSFEWYTLWKDEASSLNNFPINELRDELRQLQGEQIKATVIVQIDKDKDGSIFGASWEIGPALVFMYPDLLIHLKNHTLEFLVGREAEFSTLWNGDQIIQKRCGKLNSLTVKASRVIYVRIGTDGSSQYDLFPRNIERGCR